MDTRSQRLLFHSRLPRGGWDAALYTAEEAAELFPPPPAPTLAEAQAEKVTAINAQFATRLAAGLSYQGQVIDIDDGSRANLSGMALSALLAINKVQAWPDTISRGWVSRSGVRVPLPGPTDGLTLANAAASLYSGLVQHAADLSISVMSATDVATVAAVDETTGWPA